jgi:hypothetical protein
MVRRLDTLLGCPLPSVPSFLKTMEPKQPNSSLAAAVWPTGLTPVRRTVIEWR